MIIIRNEFSGVEVAMDHSAKGPRLMIKNERTRGAIFLDALELERLTLLRHQDLALFMDPSYESK